MPHAVLEWGISIIQSIQTARSPMLDHFFIVMSELGSEYFYFVALPIICTMIHRAIGIRLALTILLSVMLNSFIKQLVAEPRPFFFDPSLAVVSETGFGFPSGHTQQAALFWGLAIHYYRKWWFIVFGAFFVGLVALSRVYLGVHYPTDILGSIVIASLIIFKHHFLVTKGEALWRAPTKYYVFAFAALLSIISSYYIPSKDMISAAGLGLGLLAAILFVNNLPPLLNSFKERFAIAALTAIFLAVAFFGLKFIFPAKGSDYYAFFSYVRYFACGVLLNGVPIYAARLLKLAP